MFKNPIIPWILAVFGITMAVLFSMRANRATQQAVIAETRADAAEARSNRSESIAELAGAEPATFVRLEGSSITYLVPVTIGAGADALVRQATKSATVTEDITVVSDADVSGLEALSATTPGTPIRIRSYIDDRGQVHVDTVFILQ
jgi:hypothetical protein